MTDQDEVLYGRMRAWFEPVRMTADLDAVTIRGGTLRHRRRAGAAGVVVAVAAMAVALNLPARVGESSSLELVGWSVVPEADGTVNLTIRELVDADGLSARLRQEGVPVRVDFQPAGSPPCAGERAGRPEINQVVKPQGGRVGEVRYRILPDAMPAGTTLHFVVAGGLKGHVRMSLVDGVADPC